MSGNEPKDPKENLGGTEDDDTFGDEEASQQGANEEHDDADVGQAAENQARREAFKKLHGDD